MCGGMCGVYRSEQVTTLRVLDGLRYSYTFTVGIPMVKELRYDCMVKGSSYLKNVKTHIQVRQHYNTRLHHDNRRWTHI